MGSIPRTMLPLVFIFAAEYIVPEWMAAKVAALVPMTLNPYQALLLAFGLAYFPMGARLIVQMSSGYMDNVDPTGNKMKLCATNKFASRLNAAHNNLMEGFPFFAAAVLSCMQVGVSKTVLSEYCVFYLVMRSAFVVIYAIQSNEALGGLRTLTWAFSTATVGKLFILAAA